MSLIRTTKTLSLAMLVGAGLLAWPACGGGDGPEVRGGSGGSGGTGGTVGAFTVAGTISTSAFAFLDGDTNDPSNPTQGNDGANTADVQAVGNPAVVGGYLGPIDADGGANDLNDFYSVSLAAGQAATLFIADPSVTDFDLILLNDAGDAVLDSSLGTGALEEVVAPSNGQFFIVVTACLDADCFNISGPGLYNLTVGPRFNPEIARHKLSSVHEFVEGEVLVSEGAQLVSAKARLPGGWSQMDARFDLKRIRRAPLVERWKIRARVSALHGTAAPPTLFDRAAVYSPTIDAVKRLRRAGVESASPNYIRHATAIPNDDLYSQQWHYPMIGLPQAWDVTQGAGVIVAVIDSGIVSQHPDLRNQLVPGFDFISDAAVAGDGDGIDNDPEDVGDLNINGQRSTFHGTHVAGTIAAQTNNQIGVAGVAYGARLMNLRVLGMGGGADSDICQAILFAAGLPNVSGTVPDDRADVINMSLGGEGPPTCFPDAIDQAQQTGSIVVMAAGNNASDANGFSPGSVPAGITVSAVDPNKNQASYSNFGTPIDVAAPGGDVNLPGGGVLSTLATDTGQHIYDFYQGTSMAAPHVAGVIALMKAIHPGLTAGDFDALLQGNHPQTSTRITEDLGDPGLDGAYGHGLLDALAAVRAAGELAGAPVLDSPVLRVDPLSLNLTPAQLSADITVRNGGQGELAVSNVAADAAWLQVNPTAGGEGAYTVTANVSGLDDGIYQGTVSFSSNGGEATVAVRLSVGAPSAMGGDIGTLYVLLLNDQFDTVAEAATSAAEGYRYTLSGVGPGTYVVFAGTDVDNNNFIDDLGEALGGFPTLSDPLAIEVTESISGVDFSAGF